MLSSSSSSCPDCLACGWISNNQQERAYTGVWWVAHLLWQLAVAMTGWLLPSAAGNSQRRCQ
jgi:hypothetical protein